LSTNDAVFAYKISFGGLVTEFLATKKAERNLGAAGRSAGATL